MRTAVAVRYRVHAEAADDNERLIAAVFDQLQAEAPEGLHYAAFRVGDDATSFLHVALLDDHDGNPLPNLSAFQTFQRQLDRRCATAPTAERGGMVGSYRLY